MSLERTRQREAYAELRRQQTEDDFLIAMAARRTDRRVAHHRPLHPARCRAAALSALSCVDHVTITDDEVPVDLLDRLCPDRYLRV